MLDRLPKYLPSLGDMLEDLGSPSNEKVGHCLGVDRATVRRWKESNRAPRAVQLALYWQTRWGRHELSERTSQRDYMETIHLLMVDALKRQVATLEAEIERLGRIGDFGAANDPSSEPRRGAQPQAAVASGYRPQGPLAVAPASAPRPREPTKREKRSALVERRLAKRAHGPPKPFDFLRSKPPLPITQEPQANRPAPPKNQPVDPEKPREKTMHIPYVRKTKEPRRSKLELTPGYRLIRGAPEGWNEDRMLRHLQREIRADERSASGRRFRIRLRTLRALRKAAA